MKILGLNGVYPRSHDSSAAIINGSELVAFAEEERFLRVKKAFDHQPINSQVYCLEEADLDVNELDVISYGWTGATPLSADELLPEQYTKRLKRELPVSQVEHHEAHAASVFYTSPFSESAILVIDGQGESESTTIWKANESGVEKLASFPIDQSLGYMYGAISNYCGLGSFGAGKLMGLAPYGEPRYVEELAAIYDLIDLPPQTGHDSQDAYFNRFIEALDRKGFSGATYSYIFDPATAKVRQEPNLQKIHKDLAASAQAFLELKVLELANQSKILTGSKNLCMAGGVAMNCVTNSLVQNSGLFEEVFLQPACEDSGMAIGSALAIAKSKIGLPTVYTGPGFGDAQIAEQIMHYGLPCKQYEDIPTKVAQLLSQNKVIGWFQGALEFGPRALGGRSILANPSSVATRDRINSIKSREEWRPFGPSILAEYADDLFENAHESRFMLRSFDVKEVWHDDLSAVVHVDGSTRPQTVTAADSEMYRRLLEEFYGLTGIPGVLNTSFNNFDEPIVASPSDAIRTFYTTGLDALAIGSFLLTK